MLEAVMKRVACAFLLILTPSAFSVAEAQSMAELAAKEKEKRKAQKTGKVYDEYELKRSGQGIPAYVPASTTGSTTGSTAASPAPTTAAAGQAGAKEKTADELQAEAEKAWRDKLQKANQEVQNLTDLQGKIQNGLNDMTGNVYGSQRTTLLGQLERVKADLAAAQQRVADLQEEGRRSRFRQ
jgi:hypothetical protein